MMPPGVVLNRVASASTASGQPGGKVVPALHQRCVRFTPPETMTYARSASTSSANSPSARLMCASISCGCASIRRVEIPAITCSNAARRCSAKARARSRRPRCTRTPTRASEVAYSKTRNSRAVVLDAVCRVRIIVRRAFSSPLLGAASNARSTRSVVGRRS